MAENTARPRRRRSTAALERLESARRRRAEQLERERANERRIDEALGPFAEAAAAVESIERKRDSRITALEEQLERKLAELDRQKEVKTGEHHRRCDEVRADAAMEIAEWREVMSASVRQIRAAEVTLSATATLLGLPVKAVTALLRDSADDEAEASAPTSTAPKASAGRFSAPGVDGEPLVNDAAPDSAEVDRAAPDMGDASVGVDERTVHQEMSD
ncbi:hypothetical protein ED92_39225 [Amycolatopsis sp. MJM2582]|uniref:hypothetical protein n=1 Tax=Amycolatopsis sp. MJM2582 TaxID=1427749 RepID=UPI0005046A74|nr:hypothetical protein [Amycolatopsis sp. MJM2582]KFZ77112.1 hypothetical protein ED92_39225 [Amycolatopsis sp. MJM2582]